MLSFFSALNATHPLSSEAQAALLKVIRAKELRKGQVWLHEGAVCDKITFVVTGLLKLYFESGAKELVISFTRENNFSLSADSFYNQLSSRYSIRSIEPTIVIYILRNELLSLVERFSELNLHLKCIAEQHLLVLEYHNALLMVSPKERYAQLSLDYPWMVDGSRLTDRMLAAYLGVGANAVCQWRKA